MNNKTSLFLSRYLIPGTSDIIFVIFFYLILVLGTFLFRDGDPGRHITLGRYMIKTLSLPIEDIFSYTTKGVFLPPYEWLSQVSFGLAYNIGGLNGVVLLVASILSSTFALIYRELRSQGITSILAMIAILWLAFLSMVHWAARPHIYSFLFLAILTHRLSRLAKGEQIPLWQFPAIMVIWVNTHGAGFILAFFLWLAFISGNIYEQWQKSESIDNLILRKLFVSALLSLLASLINPVGWKLWQFILGFMGNSYLLEIAGETRSVTFHSFNGWPFLLTIMLSLIILSRAKEKSTMAESFLLAGWTALGLYGWRNIPLYAIIVIPLLAKYAKYSLPRIPVIISISKHIDNLEMQLRNGLWSMAAIVIFLFVLTSGINLDANKEGYHFNKVEFPVEAVAWLRDNPQKGNMFNYFPWGGYLAYSIWPEYTIFIDGQMIYIESLVKEYQQVLNAKDDWETVINNYNIEWMLVPSSSEIVLSLQDSVRWTILYQDNTSTILRQK